MRDIIVSLKKSDTWKIQLTRAVNFIYSKHDDEEHVMHLKSNNIEFMSYDNVMKLLVNFSSHFFQDCLETSMRGSNFIYESVQLLYYKCHKINFKRGGSYIDSPDCIKKKKTTINLKNTDDKCFQYAVTVLLNYEEID